MPSRRPNRGPKYSGLADRHRCDCGARCTEIRGVHRDWSGSGTMKTSRRRACGLFGPTRRRRTGTAVTSGTVDLGSRCRTRPCRESRRRLTAPLARCQRRALPWWPARRTPGQSAMGASPHHGGSNETLASCVMSADGGSCHRVELHHIPLSDIDRACPLELALMYRTVRKNHESSRLAFLGEANEEPCSQQRGSHDRSAHAVMASTCRHLSIRAFKRAEMTRLHSAGQRRNPTTRNPHAKTTQVSPGRDAIKP